MREFFKGWRRKAGCVTLVMALTLLTGWLRSQLVTDRLVFPLFGVSHQIISGNGGFLWVLQHSSKIDSVVNRRPLMWRTGKPSSEHGGSILYFERYSLAEPRSTEKTVSVNSLTFWYMLPLIPLTLFSAWLLLTKPRPAKPKTTETEAAPTTGDSHA